MMPAYIEQRAFPMMVRLALSDRVSQRIVKGVDELGRQYIGYIIPDKLV